MLHTIQNEDLKCSIESIGAEIRSLIHKESGRDFIWQMDPEIWASSSPVLFPAIGKIKADHIEYQGQKYAMPKHGIIRHNENLSFAQLSDSTCAFTLESNLRTKAQYPFQFRFRVEYELEAKSLVMRYLIENMDQVEMPFICGGHTAYACPLDADTKLIDYYLQFETSKSSLEASTLAASGLLGSKKRHFALDQGRLFLSATIFNDDALIFADSNLGEVLLGHKDRGEILKVCFKDFTHLALWSKPGADYVCIEPWSGLPDHEEESIDIIAKQSYRKLKPGEMGVFEIRTEVFA